MNNYLTEDENLAELVKLISEHDQALFADMTAARIEAAFSGRYLVVYKPTGLNADRTHREPEILTTIGFSDFESDSVNGADVVVHDYKAGEQMVIGHVPTRLFDYDMFLHIPPVYRCRWDARHSDGRLIRSLVFPINVWTRNRSSHYSAGATYAETPNRFKDLYPGVKPQLHFD
jgi:hypothetical protein